MAAMALCACAGVSGLPATPARFASRARTRSAPLAGPLVIGVLVNGWHSGLILPRREIGPLKGLLRQGPGVRYLSFGWGNRRFYMARHPSLEEALRALFSSPSVVLVEGAASAAGLVSAGGSYRMLCADQREVARVDAYLRAALQRHAGQLVVVRAEPQMDGVFYASSERYDALHTCNTWTAAALAYAGFPVRASGVVFSRQLASQIKMLRVCRVPSAHD